MKKKGLFITFEGGEGGGKSTQIQRLAETFRAKGREVVLTREPGGTPIADQIRALLLSHQLKGVVPLAELLLYEASRAQHVKERIEPALKRGAVVISDRFADSSVVYQGVGRKIKPALVRTLNAIATEGLKPHLTFIFDLDPREGFKRIGARAALDRLESEGMKFHNAVRQGYLKLARSEPRRCFKINAAQAPEKVEADILALLKKKKVLA